MVKDFLLHVMAKIASGRWILTVICGAVFAYGVIHNTIPRDAQVSILTMVFVSYFNKLSEPKNEGAQQK